MNSMRTRILCLIMAAFLAITVPVAAQTGEVNWTYDNSFLATVEWPQNQPFGAVFPESFRSAYVISKTPGQNIDIYRVVYTSVEETDRELWEYYSRNISNWQGVTQVSRNPYAVDYSQKASYITPSQTEICLAVGETAQVQVKEYLLVGNDGGEMIGVEFTVDPAIFPNIQKDCFVSLGIADFWAVPADAVKSEQGNPVYENYDAYYSDGWFDEQYHNAPSQTNTYFGVVKESDEDWMVGICLRQAAATLNTLTGHEGIQSVQPMYRLPFPTGHRPYEWWELEGDAAEVVSVEAIDHPEENAAPSAHTECFFHDHLVTLKGVKEGASVLRVTKSNGTSHTIEIPVTVTLTGELAQGDVNGDGVVDAADALLILKAAVGKYFFDNNPQGERVADLDGNGTLDAVDALMVLRIAVGKPAVPR